MKIDVRTKDGTADCYLHRPSKEGVLPGVILFPDAFGVRPAIHDMAQHLADHGYVVLVPNPFYRSGPFAPFDAKTAFTNPPERERLMKLMHLLDPDSAMRDFGSYLDALSSQPAVKPGPMGVIGYCMGARLSFLAAAAHPDRIGAIAGFHPGGLVDDKPTSPHLKAGHIKARVYLGMADNDRGATKEQQATLRKALEDAHVRFELELYEGKLHGFAVTDSGVFDPDAQARHWKKAFELFDAELGQRR